jgi:hypothetical protein
MNKKIAIGLAALLLACGVQAQTNNTAGPTQTNQTDNSGFWKPLRSATNYAAIPYGDYFENNHKIGGGLLVEYNFNEYVGSGLGLDYAGQFYAMSGNLTFNYSIQPFKNSSHPFLKNIMLTSFGLAGAGTPLAGAGSDNSGLMTVEGAGEGVRLCSWGSNEENSFGLGYAGQIRQNAGAYSGLAHTLFLKFVVCF